MEKVTTVKLNELEDLMYEDDSRAEKAAAHEAAAKDVARKLAVAIAKADSSDGGGAVVVYDEEERLWQGLQPREDRIRQLSRPQPAVTDGGQDDDCTDHHAHRGRGAAQGRTRAAAAVGTAWRDRGSRMSRECAACEYRDIPNYEHVHWVDLLPDGRDSETRSFHRGYAVGMSGKLPHMWVFFSSLEPAYVFGRAGRQSSPDISGYGVYEAVCEVRYIEKRGDVRTLHVGIRRQVPRGMPDEGEIFQAWIRGCRPTSSHFWPK